MGPGWDGIARLIYVLDPAPEGASGPFATPRPLAEDGRLTMEREPDVVAAKPIAGRLVSELIVDGKTSLDISGFRFSRFAEGAIGKPRSVL